MKWLALLLGQIFAAFGWRQAGKNSARADQAEGTLDTIQARDEIAKEVRTDDDQALIDRISDPDTD